MMGLLWFPISLVTTQNRGWDRLEPKKEKRGVRDGQALAQTARKGEQMNAEQRFVPEAGEGQGHEFDQLIDGSHRYTDVFSDEYVGPGSAHHHYLIKNKDGSNFLALRFQDGPIKESGINGIMDENLMAIVIDRLRGFQNGPYKCRENAIALTKLEESLMWLKERSRGREARGVEGTHKV